MSERKGGVDEDGGARGLSMQGIAEPRMALSFMPGVSGSHWKVLSRVDMV